MEKKKPYIFLIAGKARHGKDTVGDYLINYYEKKNKKSLKLSFGSYIKMYAKEISNWDGSEETKPRELLQTLGTELIRKQIDEDFFVNRICDDIKVYSYFFDVLVLSDVRMKNEIMLTESMFDNVIKIKIVRPNLKSELTNKQQNHITEKALDDYNDYDYVIINDGSLKDLENKIEKLAEVIDNEH